jgi:hypothetical protein
VSGVLLNAMGQAVRGSGWQALPTPTASGLCCGLGDHTSTLTTLLKVICRHIAQGYEAEAQDHAASLHSAKRLRRRAL